MIRVALLRNGSLEQGGLELIERWSADAGERLWVDLEGETESDAEPLLEGRFGFHELAAEDSFSQSTLPKHDPFPDYDFFIFRAINLNLLDHGVATTKLAVFLSTSYLITVHVDPLVSVDAIWQRLPQDRRLIEQGSDFLFQAVLDHLIDLHFPLVEEIEHMVDEIQDIIFKSPSPHLLDELLKVKKDLNTLRRYALPQRDLLNQISRGEVRFIARDHLIYFRDLYDHMFRITESIDMERDMVASTMEAYLSVVANRTNEIMKVLTVFSAIMLPLNLVAAVYGMNFEYMPELGWKHGYGFAIGIMGVIAIVMLIYFVRKGWIWGSRDLRRVRRHGYKAITWPVRLVRVAAKRAVR
ncbi:MAG TPA: magnesium/cobalt transporter CorA [Thermoanaerobaculia bacterium]|nr:magnesium/cobalt transporter CorA [Thermoanaerobaculia bacterium]